MKAFLSFIFSKTFLKQLAIAIGITIIGLFATVFFLNKYTHHGVTYTVPNLYGLSVDEATKALEVHNLQLVVSDSLFVATAPAGSVIDQTPVSEQQVKEGRKIFVSICAQEPDKVGAPDLTDVSLRQAKNMLQSVGLLLGNVEYKSSEFENLVLEQKLNGQPISPGEMINKGTLINLVVGKKGRIETVIVPNLQGDLKDEVEQRLNNMQLALGAVIYDHTVKTAEDSAAARVWRQRPFASEDNARIEVGGIVDVWLTIDSTYYAPADVDEGIIYEDEDNSNSVNFDDF